jgi:glyoxylate/hydroxypyruvate reductase
MAELTTSYVLFATIRYAREIPLFERAQRRRERPYVHPQALSAVELSVLGLGVPGRR